MEAFNNNFILFCAGVLIYLACAYVIVWTFRNDKVSKGIIRAAVVFGTASFSWLIGHLLKDYIHHTRPSGVITLLTPVDPYSLPSGHASFMFGLAAATYRYDKQSGTVLYILALLTGIGRVLAGVHFWYDIVAGASLGYLTAQLVFFAIYKLRLKNAV